MLKVFKDDNASARLLLSRDFKDRFHELGIHKDSDYYAELSKDEIDSYIKKPISCKNSLIFSSAAGITSRTAVWLTI